MGKRQRCIQQLPLQEVPQLGPKQLASKSPCLLILPLGNLWGAMQGEGRLLSCKHLPPTPIFICLANYLLQQPSRCPSNIRRHGHVGALAFWVQAASSRRVGERLGTVDTVSLGTGRHSTPGKDGEPV